MTGILREFEGNLREFEGVLGKNTQNVQNKHRSLTLSVRVHDARCVQQAHDKDLIYGGLNYVQ